jgi:hypothetical protein
MQKLSYAPSKPARVRRFEQVASFCRSTFEATGIMPSYSTIADALNIHDRATVRQYVVQAEDRGLLIRSGKCTGGAGRREGQRIRLGTPEEAAEGRQRIKVGCEL